MYNFAASISCFLGITIDILLFKRRYNVVIFIFEVLAKFHSLEDNATIEVSALVDCISASHACDGWELVYAYLTGVGFLVVAYLSERQCETPRRWVSNK